MKIVLDTNVVLVSISSRSSYHWVFKQLLLGKYQLAVSTDILEEYEEIIGQHMGEEAAKYALSTLTELPNVLFIEKYFRFQLLQDPDDNKFVDCAVAANVDYLVSQDKDFNVLAQIEFPKVNVISAQEFKKLLL